VRRSKKECYTVKIVKQEKFWNREYILTMIASFFWAFVVYSLFATLAVYSAEKYGISPGLAGFTASIGMIGGIAGRTLAGRYSERVGRRRYAFLMGGLNIIACALYFLPVGLGPFLAIRIFHGFAGAGIHNVLGTSVIDFIPPARRAEGIGIYTLHFTLAVAIGPPLGMFLIRTWSYSAFWVVNLCCGFAALIVICIIRFAPTRFTEEQMAEIRGKAGFFSGFFDKMALPLALMITLVGLAYSYVTSFLETYTIHLGVSWAAAVFFIVYSIGVMLYRPFAGRMADRRGENFVMVPSLLFFALSLILLGIAGFFPIGTVPILIIASAVIMAIGYGSIMPIGQAVAVKYAQPHRYSRIISTYFVFSEIGMGTGALILGFFAARIGFSNMFLSSIILIFAALAVYWKLHGRFHRGATDSLN